MKKFFIFSLMLFIVGSASAKESSLSITERTEILIKNQKEFSEDPLGYIVKNIRISDYIDLEGGERGEFYQVTFKAQKGFLRAIYNDKGKLRKSFQKFHNIMLPYEIRNELFSRYPGSDLLYVEYRGYGKNGTIEREVYKIKIAYAGKIKNVKIRAQA